MRSYLSFSTHNWHLSAKDTALLLTLLVLLSSCSLTNSPPTKGPTPTPQAVVTPVPTWFTTPSPTPTPEPPPLGLAPQSCPASPPPHNVFSDVGPGYGSFPVWVFGLEPTVRIPTSYFTYTQYGWTWKLIWRVSIHYTQPVQLHGGNLRIGTPLWFQTSNPVSTSPVLDPRPGEQEIAQSGFPTEAVEWGSYLFIPAAGCYYLEATWPGGSWRITFAAGQL